MANKGFIFDLDGVIVDTAKFHFIAWKRLADQLGFKFTEEDNERLKGVSRTRSLEILLEIGGVSISEDEKLRLATLKNEWYVELIGSLTSKDILPGAADFLKEASKQSIKIALGSASKNAPFILEKLGIDQLFDARIDGTHVSNAKPDPEVFLKGAEAMGLPPKDCLVFEDAQAGIEAAKRGGMKCIGIGSNEVLKGADMIVTGMDRITVEQAIELLEQ